MIRCYLDVDTETRAAAYVSVRRHFENEGG